MADGAPAGGGGADDDVPRANSSWDADEDETSIRESLHAALTASSTSATSASAPSDEGVTARPPGDLRHADDRDEAVLVSVRERMVPVESDIAAFHTLPSMPSDDPLLLHALGAAPVDDDPDASTARVSTEADAPSLGLSSAPTVGGVTVDDQTRYERLVKHTIAAAVACVDGRRDYRLSIVSRAHEQHELPAVTVDVEYRVDGGPVHERHALSPPLSASASVGAGRSVLLAGDYSASDSAASAASVLSTEFADQSYARSASSGAWARSWHADRVAADLVCLRRRSSHTLAADTTAKRSSTGAPAMTSSMSPVSADALQTHAHRALDDGWRVVQCRQPPHRFVRYRQTGVDE